jgi:N-acetylglucosaminyl-diphospho-decaprenol L-rhamnosyltransferase
MNMGAEPDQRVRVLVVIVNYKTAALTAACLRSLAPEVAADRSIRVVVVENDSGDGETIRAAIAQHGWADWVALTIAERNGGFSYGNNRGIEPALRWPTPPDYFLLLNPDTEIKPGAVRALVDHMDANPRVGIAGSSFENQDGVEWPIAFRFPTVWGQFAQGIRSTHVSKLLRNRVVARTMDGTATEVDWVAGASMMVRREVIRDIGLMDERYFLYFEEVDFCLRARRAGWPCWYVPKSRVMHVSGQSTGVSGPERKVNRMPKYWFASRSRFFVKNHGLAYARLTDLAFGLGRSVWALRRLLSKRSDEDPPWLLADFWRTSVLFQRRKSVNRWIDGRPSDNASTTAARKSEHGH